MKLKFQFLDDKGNLIEQFVNTPDEAMELIKQFITMHGEENELGGSIAFAPTEDKCGKCGSEIHNDCFGNPRCEDCDPPCPGCYDGGGPNG